MSTLTFTRDLYNNPTELQMVILDSVQNRLLNGTGVVSDPNQPFIFLLETACTLSANAIEGVSNDFPSIHTNRAQTMEDLYKNLSDFDYIELFATPSATSMSIILNKSELINKGRPYITPAGEATDYLMMQLPKDTSITFGPYSFGIYYPINVLVTKDTNLVHVNYDTRSINPLKSLSANELEFREFKYGLTNLIEINLPIDQFNLQTTYLDVSKVAGLNKKISYNDRLYAIRVYSYKSETWNELNVVYNETIYDPNSPTIIVKVFQDMKQCQLIIPQIYFEKEQIGSKIRVELYTTLGSIDIDISNLEASTIKVSIPSQTENPDKAYAEVFNKLDTVIVKPHKSIIAGGTNEADFLTIKKRIQNRISINGLLCSPGQLQTHYEGLGYSVDHMKDSFEERLYAACGLLTDFDEVPLQAGMFVTEIPLVVPAHAKKHVVETENAITVLPTAIFRYSEELERAYFLSEMEENIINELYEKDLSAFCLFLNENHFTRNIFHIHIRKKNKTPYLTNYDLARPSVDALRFMSENIRTAEQIMVVDYSIEHDCFSKTMDVSKHHYKLRVKTKCTEGIKELLTFNTSDVKLLVNITSTNNIELYQFAKPVGFDPDDPDKYLFDIIFYPSYEFNTYGEIALEVMNQTLDETTGFFTSEFTSKAYIDLNLKLNLVFLVRYNQIADQQLLILNDVVDSTYRQLTYQEMDVTLGYNLHNKLYSNIDLLYYRTDKTIDGDDNYVVTQTEYERYPDDVYSREEDGSLVVKLKTDLVEDGYVKKPDLTIESYSQNGIIRCSEFTIIIGNQVEKISTPTLKVTNDTVLGSIESTPFANDFTGFSQVQAPRLFVKDDSVTGMIYSSPFSIIHGCVGVIKPPVLKIADKSVVGVIESSDFECNVVCEITKIDLEKEHNEGDLILDETGKPIVKNLAGTVRLELNGEPKVHPREILFMSNILHVSLNLYYSGIKYSSTIFKNICDRVYAQFSRIEGSADRLLENTYIVYKPSTCMGKGKFYANSSKLIDHPLGISLKFKCYIPEYSLSDSSLQKMIRSQIILIVEGMLEEGRLSVTEVSDKIKLYFPDIIRHVDIFGINGDMNLQLIEGVEKSKRPIIKQDLGLDENKMIALSKAIIVQFVS